MRVLSVHFRTRGAKPTPKTATFVGRVTWTDFPMRVLLSIVVVLIDSAEVTVAGAGRAKADYPVANDEPVSTSMEVIDDRSR